MFFFVLHIDLFQYFENIRQSSDAIDRCVNQSNVLALSRLRHRPTPKLILEYKYLTRALRSNTGTERARRVAQKASKWAYNAATVATLALALVALRKSVVNNVKVWLKGDTEMNRVETFLLESVNVQDPKRVQLIKNLARVCYQTLRNDETITQHPFRYLLVENISKLDKLPIPHPPPPAAPLKGSRPRAKAESSVFVHTSSHDSDNIAEEIPMPPPPPSKRPPPPPSKREESVPRPPPSTEESIPVHGVRARSARI